jgi:hypothetical protein
MILLLLPFQSIDKNLEQLKIALAAHEGQGNGSLAECGLKA